ncbi:MAG: putative glycolipid-binding domain-containing protein [Patulibacter sp.]|nr:putative glycolipid-binding domain-containing protein [Patulibacter sp.]
MDLERLPAVAGWQHVASRTGFEVLFYAPANDGHTLRGQTTAIEDGTAWAVGYRVDLDREWRTLRVEATTSTAAGEHRTELRRTPDDHWFVDGVLRPELTGCVDVDFESSAVTNTLPVHRLDFRRDEPRSAPAAFVRADDLRVERLGQEYALLDRNDDEIRFAYASSTFDVACTLIYDASGLIVDYPGIAERAC